MACLDFRFLAFSIRIPTGFIFHFSGVPIALCCIAPMLAAKVFGSEGVHITLGKKGDETKVLSHFTNKLDRFA